MTYKQLKAVAPAPREMATGTSLQNYLHGVRFSWLVKVFGAPTAWGSGDGKVLCEWVLMTPLGIATIYNYKDGINYDPEGAEADDITEWHIGGATKPPTDYVIEYFQETFKSDEVEVDDEY